MDSDYSLDDFPEIAVDYVPNKVIEYGSDPQTAEYLMQGGEVAEATSASTPGFGALVASGALVAAAYMATRKDDGPEDEVEEDLEDLGDRELE